MTGTALATERNCLEEAINIQYQVSFVTHTAMMIADFETPPIGECKNHAVDSDAFLDEEIETRQEYKKYYEKNKTYPTKNLLFHDPTMPAYVSYEELCELVDREVDDLAFCRLPREKLSELIKTTIPAADREKHCLNQLEWLVPIAKKCD